MKQFTIITADRAGLTAEVTDILAKHEINILELSAKTVSGSALIELSVDRPEDAMPALSAHGLQIVTNDLITIKIDDVPGALAKVTRQLNEAGLSLRGISTLQRHQGVCYVVLTTENDAIARQLLASQLVE